MYHFNKSMSWAAMTGVGVSVGDKINRTEVVKTLQNSMTKSCNSKVVGKNTLKCKGLHVEKDAEVSQDIELSAECTLSGAVDSLTELATSQVNEDGQARAGLFNVTAVDVNVGDSINEADVEEHIRNSLTEECDETFDMINEVIVDGDCTFGEGSKFSQSIDASTECILGSSLINDSKLSTSQANDDGGDGVGAQDMDQNTMIALAALLFIFLLLFFWFFG